MTVAPARTAVFTSLLKAGDTAVAYGRSSRMKTATESASRPPSWIARVSCLAEHGAAPGRASPAAHGASAAPIWQPTYATVRVPASIVRGLHASRRSSPAPNQATPASSRMRVVLAMPWRPASAMRSVDSATASTPTDASASASSADEASCSLSQGSGTSGPASVTAVASACASSGATPEKASAYASASAVRGSSDLPVRTSPPNRSAVEPAGAGCRVTSTRSSDCASTGT